MQIKMIYQQFVTTTQYCDCIAVLTKSKWIGVHIVLWLDSSHQTNACESIAIASKEALEINTEFNVHSNFLVKYSAGIYKTRKMRIELMCNQFNGVMLRFLTFYIAQWRGGGSLILISISFLWLTIAIVRVLPWPFVLSLTSFCHVLSEPRMRALLPL